MSPTPERTLALNASSGRAACLGPDVGTPHVAPDATPKDAQPLDFGEADSAACSASSPEPDAAACSASSPEPDAAGCCSTTSRSYSSTCRSGWSHSCPPTFRSVSECAPQPWSRETTLPSSGDHSLAHTPNSWPSDPASGTTNPQLAQEAPAARDPAVSGPREPSYHRVAASSRALRFITRSRPRPSSRSASRSISSSPVPASQPGSSRSSPATYGSRSVGPTSPGASRSAHGSQAGASKESSPGSSPDSHTVAFRERGIRESVTYQRHPVYPGAVAAK